MALMRLTYRDQLFPREAYRLMFNRLIDAMSERAACRLMVELLYMAHERACEAQLADLLATDLAEDRLPDIVALRTRFAPDPATLPEISANPPCTDFLTWRNRGSAIRPRKRPAA